MIKRILGLLLLLIAGSGFYAQEDTTRVAQDTLDVAKTIDTTAPAITAADTTILYRINGTYLRSIWDDTKYTVTRPLHWEKKNFIQAGALVGLTGVLLASDYSIKQFFVHNQTNFWTSVTDQIEPFGNAYAPYIVAGMYVAGVITHDRKLESGGLMAAKSLLISTAVYTVIKSVVRRGRPTYYDSPFNFAPPFSKDKQHTSFPSGHSNTVMTVATAVAELYGKDHPWVPWVAYGIAGLTGITRMYENRHWSSDILIGMSLGHFVTKSVFRHHRELEHKKAMQLMLQ
ncbi:phosphatase PAP2 family protein [Chitinophaga sp. sic0106]|uniref:phosphatase PAP2 family protein n=1 Tax=Chitinophaga sp. sic0106 TaxID=2854785 RepID=UPI001C4924A2|nr:phosphatase PAP2 family protein [Chitinophaga sp. sic0106]MBV7531589.1 phosphatase PAP2 family protein [Chitinophaga sp. sic0106]